MKTLNYVGGDISLDGAGNLSAVTGAEALRQKIESRLSLWKGTWFLDAGAGVPFVQNIIGRGQTSVVGKSVGQLLSSELLKESEVISIIRSESILDPATRAYTFTAEVNTIYGRVELEI